MQHANPFALPVRLRQLDITLPTALLPLVEEQLEGLVLASAHDATLAELRGEAATTTASFYFDACREDAVTNAVAALAGQFFEINIKQATDVEARDWVASVQADFPPLRAGRFYVYGSHISAPPPLSAISLRIDAGAAFGTGEHATTEGCLRMLEQLGKTIMPRAMFDVGCGTAILAIGMAKQWRAGRALATDIDPVAVRVAAQNVRRNEETMRVRCMTRIGYRNVTGSYDLIVANILARPLMKMAKDAKQRLRPGGWLLLSGLLARQEQAVLSAHRMQGLYLQRRLRIGEWSVLLLRRGKR